MDSILHSICCLFGMGILTRISITCNCFLIIYSKSLGIHYFPQKYWALAIPSFFVATIFTVITGYAALNYCFCNNFNSYENFEGMN